MTSHYGSKIWMGIGMAIFAAMILVALLVAIGAVTYYSYKYNWR
jgi:hypothetical protein